MNKKQHIKKIKDFDKIFDRMQSESFWNGIKTIQTYPDLCSANMSKKVTLANKIGRYVNTVEDICKGISLDNAVVVAYLMAGGIIQLSPVKAIKLVPRTLKSSNKKRLPLPLVKKKR